MFAFCYSHFAQIGFFEFFHILMFLCESDIQEYYFAVLSKFVEKSLRKSTVNFFIENDIKSQFQFVFCDKKAYSTIFYHFFLLKFPGAEKYNFFPHK
jgi:hypothetical protein